MSKADEIKVEEYVRTKKGEIGKVIDIANNFYYLDNMLARTEKSIVKYSKNIIDLIEVGDFVNDYKILKITEVNENAKIFAIFKYETEYSYGWHNEDIKTILTKEQYERNCYRLEEENGQNN